MKQYLRNISIILIVLMLGTPITLSVQNKQINRKEIQSLNSDGFEIAFDGKNNGKSISTNMEITFNPFDEEDQKCKGGNAPFAIRNGTWAAQSFVPNCDILTRIQIYMNYTNITKGYSKSSQEQLSCYMFNSVNKLINNLAVFFHENQNKLLLKVSEFLRHKITTQNLNSMDPAGIITLSIRKDLNRDDLANKTYIYNHGMKNTKIWIEFDIPDITLIPGDTYYIILHTVNGDEKDFYNWFYHDGNKDGIDAYPLGKAYTSSNNGTQWTLLVNEYNDFTFETYGRYSYLEPEEGDGVTEYWAIITADGAAGDEADELYKYSKNNANTLYNRLKNSGWTENHIKLLVDEKVRDGVDPALIWMDEMDDGDDICVYYGFAHRNTYNVNEPFLQKLDRLGANGIAIIIESCNSGELIETIGKQGRVVITSSSADEKSYCYDDLGMGLFSYYFIQSFASSSDTNNDGWISAEESFTNLYPKVVEYSIEKTHPQHPQIYDGYIGELIIAEI